MNWDAIGAIAETLGAVGVIASLVYLAGQIRQNTRTVRSSTYQGLIGLTQQAHMPIALDGDTSEIVRKGMQNSSQMNEADAFRFHWIMSGSFAGAENAMYQFENGMLSEDRWQSQFEVIRWFVAAPGVRSWWATYTTTHMNPKFVRVVDEEIRRLEKKDILGEEPERGE